MLIFKSHLRLSWRSWRLGVLAVHQHGFGSLNVDMLEVKDLHAYYGKSHILHGVHLSVRQGEIVSLLGRNGVGRSTTIKSIMGQVSSTGSVRFKGEEINGLKAYMVARKGLGYVPENREIFPTLTVRQNLMLGMKNASSRCSRCAAR